MANLPRIDVLLATYNGAAYLRAQIDSVMAQKDVEVRLLARDDGSTDATPAILQEYAAHFPGRVIVIPKSGSTRGATDNFLALLARESDADYFAFCDQDDVWPQDRLQAAIGQLQALGTGLRLYCGAVTYVDRNLHELGNSSRPVRPSFGNALVENIAQGCTMVFDASLRRMIAENLPTRAAIHDWWLYLVAAAFGRVVFDPVPRLLYRQHGGNEVGGGVNLLQKIRKNSWRYIGGRGWRMAAQAEHLLELYPEQLTAEQKLLVRRFVAGKRSLAARLRFLLDWRIRRQSLFETLVVKFLVLINAY